MNRDSHPLNKKVQKIKSLVKEIKSDPILVALVENDNLKELFEQVEEVVQDAMQEYEYLKQREEQVLNQIDDLENEIENLRYENDRLNEIIS